MKASLDRKLTETQRAIAMIKAGGVCQWKGCGRSRDLQMAHIYSKGSYPHLKYLVENVLMMCNRPCHNVEFHGDQEAGYEWFAQEFPDEWEFLQREKRNVGTLYECHYLDQLKELKEELNRLQC